LTDILISVHWHCVVLKAREERSSPSRARPRGLDKFPVAMARGKHLFPFRTEPLSPSAPMVLGPQGPGRVGRRRFFYTNPRLLVQAGFLFCAYGFAADAVAGASHPRCRAGHLWDAAAGRRGPRPPSCSLAHACLATRGNADERVDASGLSHAREAAGPAGRLQQQTTGPPQPEALTARARSSGAAFLWESRRRPSCPPAGPEVLWRRGTRRRACRRPGRLR
jgi:hypothetical protein